MRKLRQLFLWSTVCCLVGNWELHGNISYMFMFLTNEVYKCLYKDNASGMPHLYQKWFFVHVLSATYFGEFGLNYEEFPHWPSGCIFYLRKVAIFSRVTRLHTQTVLTDPASSSACFTSTSTCFGTCTLYTLCIISMTITWWLTHLNTWVTQTYQSYSTTGIVLKHPI